MTGELDENDLNDRADAFIGYMEEDRDIVIFPLIELFRSYEAYVCELQLRPKRKMSEFVDLGLLMGRYCILVVSPRFLMRYFEPGELDAMAAREVEGERVILPLWYRVTDSQVRARSEVLADLPAVKWSDGVPAAALALWMRMFPRVPAAAAGPVFDLQPADSVAGVLDPLRSVAARRFVFETPKNFVDDGVIKGFRALLEGWLITMVAGDAGAEATMVEAFAIVFRDLRKMGWKAFAGTVTESASGADARELRPLGIVTLARLGVTRVSVIGDQVMMYK